MKDNLIFLKEKDLDKKIYRIFSFQRLKEIFDEQKLTLVKPKLWDDPFENFILNSTGILPDGRCCSFAFRDHYYGQCWSLNKESDAMWRIYSPNKDGVKVQTTIRKLFSPIFQNAGIDYKADGTPYNLSAFIGKVKYAKSKALIEMLNDTGRMNSKIFDQTGWGQASTFFFKRIPFKHEQEVRIIYDAQNGYSSDLYKVDINPFEVFERIVFDPRMPEDNYNHHRAEVKSWGYTKSIIQSGLYKLRNFKIRLNPYQI